jgi:XTP/dITP diphosphohydrolase
MIKNLIFASKNANKIKEIAAVLPAGYFLQGIDELKIVGELEEPFEKLEENALHKARTIFTKTGKAAFADDTGLEVGTLDGRPGVHSAHYAGQQRDAHANMDKLLSEMGNVNDRGAQFRTVIAYVNADGEWLFEGIVKGTISLQKQGNKGFGYDPVFLPEGQSKSFAEMELEEKNTMSHRARAFQKFIAFLDRQ